MRAWKLACPALFGLMITGCADPLIVPALMPGTKAVVEVSEADAAEAFGEAAVAGNVAVPSSKVDMSIFPASPTKEGETLTTATTLKYTTLKPGDGPAAAPADRVLVHYVGMLPNGSKFDSSRDRSQPFSFTIGEGKVIRGWELAVTGMNVGETRRMQIPAELGYGAQGRPPVIPPNSPLVFEVELLQILK